MQHIINLLKKYNTSITINDNCVRYNRTLKMFVVINITEYTIIYQSKALYPALLKLI